LVNKVIWKLTLSFSPYSLSVQPLFPLCSPLIPSFSGIHKVSKVVVAQGSRVTIVVVQVGAAKIYVAAPEALRKKERGDETQSKKLVWVPVILVCKISLPVTHLMPYFAETGRSCPVIA
jgi:hypothetical protein